MRTPNSRSNRVLTSILALALIGSAATLAVAGRTIDERGKVSPDGRVDIDNLGGSVIVEGWDRDEVTVTGTLADDAEDLIFSADERRTKIKVIFPNKRNLRRAETDLLVRVPAGSRVRVSGVSAGVEVSGITGSLDLESVSGDLVISGQPVSIEAQTVSGEVRISGDSEEIDASSVSGDVILEVPGGDVAISTVSGDIESRGGVFESADFSTVSGRIAFEGGPTESGSLDFDCHSGRIIVVFPTDLSAEIDVTTFSGDIDNDFGPRPRRTSEYAPGKELSFSVGSGDARISINTFSGGVRMSQR